MKLRCAILASLFLLLSTGLVAKDKKSAPETLANVHFTVVKDDNGKPVRNASVILHPVDKSGHQGGGGYQLKTSGEGEAGDDGVPYGKLRVQVIAPGFQTFGQDYDIDQPSMNIDIRLKRPTGQLTIYDKGGKNAGKDDGSPQQGTPVEPQPPKN
ncbi:MAG: carboxypeptidase-like regulatory domain-containing protein [Candidatus Korobacteraceae bacterium]